MDGIVRAVLNPKRYHVTTFGCQMNVHDSERIKGLLESVGLGEAAAPDEADFLVFNTCTIREKADDRLIAHLMDARAAKQRDPDKVIVVGGCWSESIRFCSFAKRAESNRRCVLIRRRFSAAAK